jgi:hypothetical protein
MGFAVSNGTIFASDLDQDQIPLDVVAQPELERNAFECAGEYLSRNLFDCRHMFHWFTVHWFTFAVEIVRPLPTFGATSGTLKQHPSHRSGLAATAAWTAEAIRTA